MAPRTRDICQSLSPKKRSFVFNGIPPKVQEPLKHGEIFCDNSLKKWKIGRCIGIGAFGEVFLASDDINKPVSNDAQFVIKVEPHSNGPLFVEMNFYLRSTKEELVDKWKTDKRKKHLGVPQILGFGSHISKNDKYRFIVLPRFGDSVSKLFIQNSKKFHVKTAFTLAIHVVDILEYIHSQGYVHVDIKGANMLLNGSSEGAPLYLVDYGLAARYTDMFGNHKEFEPDKRKADAGTLEYISRDAHLGAMSRRSDLESLGYNLVHWLTGTLPWLNSSYDSDAVAHLKNDAMSNIKAFLSSSSNETIPPVLTEFLQYVDRLSFKSEPDYNYCRVLFSQAIENAGFLSDNIITFDGHAKLKSKSKKRKAEMENYPVIKKPKLKKKIDTPSRRPFRNVVQNTITARVTRNQVDTGIKLRSSREFDWATVLAGHPEAKVQKAKKEKSVRINDNLPRAAKKSSKFWEDSLRNPTPAMLELMNKKRGRRMSDRKNKSESIGPPTYYTPAMKLVIANRQSCPATHCPTPTKVKTLRTKRNKSQVVRSSSRKTARKSADAIFACAKF